MSIIRGIPLLSPQRVRFGRTQAIPLRKLDGFTKQHRVPTVYNHSTSRFVANLVRPQLESTFQSLHSFLREEFSLKRKEIDINLDEDGAGILESPVLRFESIYRINPDDLEQIVHEVWLDQLPDLNIVSQPEFERGFGHRFCELETPLDTPISVETLIDVMETLPVEDKVFLVEYPYSENRCELIRKGSSDRLVFEDNRIRMEVALPRFPKDLVLELAHFDAALSRIFR